MLLFLRGRAREIRTVIKEVRNHFAHSGSFLSVFYRLFLSRVRRYRCKFGRYIAPITMQRVVREQREPRTLFEADNAYENVPLALSQVSRYSRDFHRKTTAKTPKLAFRDEKVSINFPSRFVEEAKNCYLVYWRWEKYFCIFMAFVRNWMNIELFFWNYCDTFFSTGLFFFLIEWP